MLKNAEYGELFPSWNNAFPCTSSSSIVTDGIKDVFVVTTILVIPSSPLSITFCGSTTVFTI